MSLEETFLDELFSDLESERLVLPTLPEVALKVRDTLEDDNASMTDAAKIITSDVALSARLIQVANSPLLRASRKIESVEAAVTRMGSDMVRNLVTSLAMEQMFQATTDVTDKRLREIWEHSTEIAAICHAMSAMAPNLKADQALLAGLVHNIGALPVLVRAEDHPDLISNSALLDKIVANTNPKLGAAILRKWHFSEDLITVAEEHSNFTRSHDGAADYADLVIVAELQSRAGSDHPNAKIDWSTVPAFNKLGIEADVSVIDMDEANKEIEAVKAALIS